ncbi:fibronectin type III domain-containing protein [Microbacterium sp. Se63.02b]|uniref:fibronectin type III domain-containing protein n=1 Tax=Microbacterium sp. Se63.02b TaxID=2709304 RepID=UPI00237BBC2A|nr:fibronectin type III domain-containing protein [Microbacterium sp. Se63.02b]
MAFGDKSLKVAWVTPSTPGSPVERYTLEISPAPPSGITQKEVTGNSTTWEGLENGSDYQVRVQAHNRAPDPSSWSGWSASEIPAGPPLPPAAPTTSELSPVDGRAQMQVSWTTPDKNGDAIRGYRLEVLRGGQVIDTLTPGPEALSQTVVVDPSETAYTYRIQANNKAGWGDLSAESAPRRGVVPPGAPTSLKVTKEGDRALTISFNEGSRGGATAGEITNQYRLNGGSWNTVPGNRVIGGLTNGKDYRVEVRAVANVSGSTYPGAVSNSATGNPYGVPSPPAVSAESLESQVRLNWNANGSANGRNITEVHISIDGGGWQGVAATGSVNVGTYSEHHTIRARAKDSTGVWSDVSPSAGATAKDKPQPRWWASQGTDSGNCSPDTCYYLNLNTSNVPAGQYRIRCLENGTPYRSASGQTSNYNTYNVPANGTIRLSCWHGGMNRTLQADIQGVGWSEATSWP